MTQRFDKYGRPWSPAPPRPPLKGGGIASRARSIRWAIARGEDPARTARSKIYWTAYRAGQIAKREAGMDYQPPPWLLPPRRLKNLTPKSVSATPEKSCRNGKEPTS